MMMIRSACVGMAGFFWLASTVAAQPAGIPQSAASPDWQTPRLLHSASAQAIPGSVNASSGQPARSFEDLRLRIRVGDTVRVADASGRETSGRVAAVSDVAITLTVDGTPREFVADTVRQIDRRRRDSIRNGLLIGAGGGALLGYGLGRSADSPACPQSGSECGQGALIGTVGGALWGAIGGWITDTVIRKREVVYLAPGSK
jgi:hypothetical protein